MGTKEGGIAAAQTNKDKYGDDFYTRIAHKSQESYMAKPKEERKPRGFSAMSAERRAELGSKGGQIGRRNSTKHFDRKAYLKRVKEYASKHNQEGQAA